MYTAKDIREQRISFRDLTKEQCEILTAHFHKLYPDDEYNIHFQDLDLRKENNFARFYECKDIQNPFKTMGIKYNSYLSSLSENIRSTKEITFEEFDFEEQIEVQETILQEADRLINGERAADYGDVTENFERIAKGGSVIFGVDITARQVAHFMIWLKMCRDLNKPKRDNIVDIAGYAGCIEKLKK